MEKITTAWNATELSELHGTSSADSKTQVPLLFALGANERGHVLRMDTERRTQAPSAGQRAPPPQAQGSPGRARPKAQAQPALQSFAFLTVAQATACPPGARASSVVRCAIRGLARKSFLADPPVRPQGP